LKVFISGYNGWLCNRLVERILKETNWDIKCLMLENAKGPFDRDIEIVRGDITDYDSFTSEMKDCDLVIHAAGIIHAKPSVMREINTYGTFNMITSTLAAKVPKFIYISSNSVSGYTKDKILMNESYSNPYMTYGKTKYLAEEIVKNSSYGKDISSIVLRPCRYYGPYPPKRDLDLFKLIKSGKGILFGDGKQLRSMTYTDNLIDAIFLAAKYNANIDTFWIADERPYTNIEIIETIASILDVKKLKQLYIPNIFSKGCMNLDRMIQYLGYYNMLIHVTGEISTNIGCTIEKAKNVLGYQPRISLHEGMKREIEWLKEEGKL